MSDKVTPPDLSGELSDLKKRIDALERQLRPLASVFKPDITFSYAGALAAASSPPWVSRESRRLIEVVAALNTAGSTDTTIHILKNGSEALSVTIPATVLKVQVPCNIFLGADQDILSDEIVTAGTSAADLTVIHRFRR